MPRRIDAAGAAPAAAALQPAVGPQQAAPQVLPSLPDLTYDTVVVQPEGTDGITLPKFLLPDGRNPVKPMVTFIPQRYVEIVLFNRYDGGSSGAISKILNKNGLGSTAWTINAAAVLNNEVSQAHASFILTKFKEFLPTDGDPMLATRTRNIVLLPVAAAAGSRMGK
mgnify:CR=1 FL=1